jgi:hypothetical protein
MKVIEQIPAMTDTQLANLRSNAERLSKDGTSAQKTAAASVLESVNAQIGVRNAAKREAMAERRAKAAADKPPTTRAPRAKKAKVAKAPKDAAVDGAA